ncbi:(R)-hydratase [Azoarcus sp. TTM-91]|uniref:MaoC family dehydratase n=1 Tax=Azoarcus sp. TTM-91 TaxID=2691581 RepID=UPI00145F43F0|nr:MaoC family dehydratase [Azoarcus sp. TTM-91]NMG35274.1 (R)-hydratase [Azoarcus sp. TTM-91]
MPQSTRDFTELYGFQFEELFIGQTAVSSHTVTDADLLLFSGVSGDTNPVHLDAEFAAASMFKERIAHGMLSAAYISAVFGTKLPGPGCIYLSQNLKFKAPVKIGATVVTRVTVERLNVEKRRAVFLTECRVGETVVLTGEAELLIPKRD